MQVCDFNINNSIQFKISKKHVFGGLDNPKLQGNRLVLKHIKSPTNSANTSKLEL